MTENVGGSNPNEHKNAKAEAAASKAYSKASRPWYKKKRWWLVTVVVVMFMAAAAGGSGSSDEEPAAAQSTTEPAASEEPGASEDTVADDEPTAEEQATAEDAPAASKPVAVQAKKMVKEFEQNELAADAKYKGKDLKITGRVAKIDTDVWDDEKYILSLGGKWDILTVDCNDMSTDELSTLKVGQTVTVLGSFDDGGDLGVQVKDCHLA